ncbi:MAG TPA: hypothetical protein VFK50_03910 [Sphingomicrobium sp.]|nr:hypothetical protein [Sphingomicrobium sp.]
MALEIEMRALFIVAVSCLVLSACGDNSANEGGANVSGNLAAEAIFANDTTVIDAATGDASNMAADVAYNIDQLDLSGDVRSDGKVDRQTVRRRQPASSQPSSNETDSAPALETATETNAL